ncbi:NUDIX domain-containing protein [Novosphingobium lubricantis]
MLPLDTFLRVVDATPLIAIDLIVPNEDGGYLLGHRVNRPAQGFWFVPGGRIHKNERLDDAFRRIARFHGSFRQIDGVLQTGDGCGHGRNVHLVPRLVVGRARSRLNHLRACALTVRAGRAAA